MISEIINSVIQTSQGDMIQVFKLLNGLEDINFKRLCEISEISNTRGHRPKTQISELGVFFQGT